MGRRCDAGLVGPGTGFTRLVVATADPVTLPGKATWYLRTDCPGPATSPEAGTPHPAASLAQITRIYGIRALDRAALQAGQGRAGLG